MLLGRLFCVAVMIVGGYIILKMIAAHVRMDLEEQNEEYIEKEVQRRVRESFMNMRLNIHTEIIEDPLGHESRM